MPERPVDLVFHVPEADAEKLMHELEQQSSLRPILVRAAGAEGGGDLVTILVSLAPGMLPFLAGVASSWIAHRGSSVEIHGIKVKNVSRKAVERILREHSGEVAAAKPAKAAKKPSAKRKRAKAIAAKPRKTIKNSSASKAKTSRKQV